MGDSKPPPKAPRTSLVDSGWGEEAEAEVEPTPSPLLGTGPAAPPPPRPGALGLKGGVVKGIGGGKRPPAKRPPRPVADSITEVADLLDELGEPTESAPPMFEPRPAEPGKVPEPEPGASGILPRFAMPSESDTSSPRIIDPEAAAAEPPGSHAPAVGALPRPTAPPISNRGRSAAPAKRSGAKQGGDPGELAPGAASEPAGSAAPVSGVAASGDGVALESLSASDFVDSPEPALPLGLQPRVGLDERVGLEPPVGLEAPGLAPPVPFESAAIPAPLGAFDASGPLGAQAPSAPADHQGLGTPDPGAAVDGLLGVDPGATERAPYTGPAVDPMLPPPRSSLGALSVGEALSERVQLGGGTPPLWGLLSVGAVVLLGAGVALGALLAGSSGNSAEPVAVTSPLAAPQAPPAPTESAAAPAESAAEEGVAEAPEAAPTPSGPLAQAAAGDAEAVRALEAIAPGERSAAQAVALARGRSAQLRSAWQELGAALKADPALLEDKAKAKQVEEFARNRETATDTLELIAALGTAAAVDFLYEIWVGTPKRTETTQLAEELVTSKDLSAKAGPALAVALELRALPKDGPCADAQKLVRRAATHADVRSLTLLGRMTLRQGCGPKKNQDCYACLRQGKELPDAIKAIRQRMADAKKR